jgi:hypothetical protein
MKIKILLCKLISNINIKPRIGGVIVKVLVSRAVDRGLGVSVGSNLRLLNWYVLLSAKHAILSRNTKKTAWFGITTKCVRVERHVCPRTVS